jgi:hypothetical protein
VDAMIYELPSTNLGHTHPVTRSHRVNKFQHKKAPPENPTGLYIYSNFGLPTSVF